MLGPAALAPSPYKEEAERTIRRLERAGIAVFPSKMGRKGSYVTGWPTMAADDAITLTRQELTKKRIGLAGRTGAGCAVFDLDAKSGVDPGEMLQVLRRIVGPAIIAIVGTSRGFHIWLQVAEPVGNGFCSFIGGEIFSGPHLAMLPPSIHPSGHQYTWEVEPRDPDAAANLKSMGLVPDKPAPSPRTGSEPTPALAPSEIQQEFVRLMAEADVPRVGDRSQTLNRCPWHDDRSPSLSINWDAAVFYCFSEHCQARGGINSLRRRVRGDTPSYRQWPDVENTSLDHREGDHLSGDKLGCSDVAAAAERLAGGLQSLGLDERAVSVRDCRKYFRVGKCTACARTPAYPISCGDPLCVRCMPGRLAADWNRHRGALPERLTLLRVHPRDIAGASSGALKKVRARFREWRSRTGLIAGVYGARLDPNAGAVILLALPAELPVPESSKAFEVEVVARERGSEDFIRWLQAEYVKEAQCWETNDELASLIEETKGRRRFQGFGGVYGEAKEVAVDDHRENVEPEAVVTDGPQKRLGRISGGSLKGKHSKEPVNCSFCGGAVEWYAFSVPADQVERMGDRWLWRGARAPGATHDATL